MAYGRDENRTIGPASPPLVPCVFDLRLRARLIIAARIFSAAPHCRSSAGQASPCGKRRLTAACQEPTRHDVPMAQICWLMEIQLRQMLGETEAPSRLQPKNSIIFQVRRFPVHNADLNNTP